MHSQVNIDYNYQKLSGITGFFRKTLAALFVPVYILLMALAEPISGEINHVRESEDNFIVKIGYLALFIIAYPLLFGSNLIRDTINIKFKYKHLAVHGVTTEDYIPLATTALTLTAVLLVLFPPVALLPFVTTLSATITSALGISSISTWALAALVGVTVATTTLLTSYILEQAVSLVSNSKHKNPNSLTDNTRDNADPFADFNASSLKKLPSSSASSSSANALKTLQNNSFATVADTSNLPTSQIDTTVSAATIDDTAANSHELSASDSDDSELQEISLNNQISYFDDEIHSDDDEENADTNRPRF